jgi:hypothetical protein
MASQSKCVLGRTWFTGERIGRAHADANGASHLRAERGGGH